MKYVINLYKIEVRVVDFSVLESKEKKLSVVYHLEQLCKRPKTVNDF